MASAGPPVSRWQSRRHLSSGRAAISVKAGQRRTGVLARFRNLDEAEVEPPRPKKNNAPKRAAPARGKNVAAKVVAEVNSESIATCAPPPHLFAPFAPVRPRPPALPLCPVRPPPFGATGNRQTSWVES